MTTHVEAGVVVSLNRMDGGTGSSTPSHRLPEIGSGVGHLQTNLPAPFSGANVGDVIGADTFYTNGITGQGTVTADIEAGHIWDGHETLGHVSQFSHDASAWDDPGTPDNQLSDLYDRHATWVGMHIGGRNGGVNQGTYQTGIAPGTDLKSGAIASEWTDDAYSSGFDFTPFSFTVPYATYFGEVDVINSSWGGDSPTGTNPFAIAMDGLANQFPNTTFVTSAGNSADPDEDPDTPPVTNTVGYPGSGYNSITVGALENVNNVYNSVADFSSRGPQDWGFADFGAGSVFGCVACRAAVDIAAPGTNLTAAYYGGQTGGNNPTLTDSPAGAAGGPNFYSLAVSGTSFAAPITAGAAALLDSASYNMAELAGNPASRDARVIKAVLLNSADKIPGWDNGQVAHPNLNGGVLTTQSLDFDSGAGALNLTKAYDQYLGNTTKDVPGTPSGNQGPVDPIGWDFGEVVSGTDNVYPINETLSEGLLMTVTLSWFRERAFNVGTLEVFEIAQADLDLIVRDTATGDIISESISGVNNTEHLHFHLPRTTDYQIEVSFFGAVFDFTQALNSAEYGLAWSVVPEPASVVLLAIGLALLGGRKRRR